MTGHLPLLSATIAALLAMFAVLGWFAVVQRRRIEGEAGVTALASMKWRESLGLLMQALAAQGYREESGDQEPGDSGSLHILRRDDQTCLLGFRPGTAYRLGETSVREFANEMRLRGSNHGMLVTLGHVEGFARDSAQQQGVDLIDGETLWTRIHPYLSEPLRQAIHRQAAARIRRVIPWALATGVLTGIAIHALLPEQTDPPVSATATAAPVQRSASTPSEPAKPTSLDAAASAMAEAAELTPEGLASRRASAAAGVRELERVRSAAWTAQSTLSIALSRSVEGDQDVIDEACRILLQFEELRFTRLQLEPPPGSAAPVRWRQCQ